MLKLITDMNNQFLHSWYKPYQNDVYPSVEQTDIVNNSIGRTITHTNYIKIFANPQFKLFPKGLPLI